MTPRESQFREWVAHAPVAMFAIDGTGRYRDANPAALQMVGYPLEELCALTVAELVAPVDLARATEELPTLLTTGALDACYRLRRRDGSVFPVSLKARQVGPDAFVGFCQDLSAQRAAEAEQARSEARLADVVRSISDWAWEVDAQGRYTWVSGAVERLLGYTPQEVVGHSPFDFMPPEEAARVGQAFLQAVQARAPLVGLEKLNRHRDGHLVHLETSAVPVIDAAGALLGYRGADRDVTERVRHHEQLKRALQAAEAGALAKTQFLATVSHELRTPLNGVLGMAQLLELSALDRAQREDLATLQASANGLLGLIEDLLEYSRLEQGEVARVSRTFRPRALVEELVARLAPLAAPGVGFSLELGDGLPATLSGDDVHLGRIIEQLLENAFKFTHQGTVALRLTVRPAQGEVTPLEVTVSDTGIGMAPALLERLFQPFTQGDPSSTRAYGGLGLGLTVCKRLAELMGAQLEASSVTGRGTVVTLVAPCAPGGKAAPAARPGLSAAR